MKNLLVSKVGGQNEKKDERRKMKERKEKRKKDL